MVGVDHTSGTDTKPEITDDPQAPQSAYRPPPDRPGSPGQPSRAESRAAARAPAEDRPSAEPEADAEKPAQEAGTEGPRDPNDDPTTVGRPRAESRARAQESQEDHALQGTSDAELAEPAAERAPDNDAPDPPEAEDGEPGGENAEDQPESPAPVEDETDRFAGLPTRADLDPVSAGELTRERGEPLAPVDENQDLTESDEGEDPVKRLLKGARENTDDMVEHVDGIAGTAQDLLKAKPPTGTPSVARDVRDTNDQMRPANDHVDVGSGVLGVAAGALFVYQGVRSGIDLVKRLKGRDNDGNR